jgi:uncharacterized protein
MVLDVNSGAVHIIDKLVYDMLSEDYLEDRDTIIDRLSQEFNIDEIKEAYEEVIYLLGQGTLYSEDTNFDGVEYNKDNIIKAMCLHVAHDCNLKCKYCFASQGNFKGDRSLMDLETGKKALEFLVNSSGNRKNLEVDFFGGEPLMNFEVVKDLVAYGRELEAKYDKRFRFTITTNGVLLDEEKMNFINDNMENVVLSLDGRKSINDDMRLTLSGEGSYEVILPKIKRMVELRGNRDYYVRGTFTSHNTDFGKDALDFLNHGFKKISIEPVVAPNEMEYALKSEHLDKVLKEYEDFSKKYIKIKKDDPDFMFFHFMIDLDQGPCVIKRSVGCGAGSEYIAVTPEGEIYPCHQFVGEKQFLMGSLDSGVHNTALRDKFRNANVYSKNECKSCWAKFYCSGGCHANAFYAHSDITKPYELGCEMEKKRIECALSVAASLGEEE